MYILGYKDVNDRKYYAPVIVQAFGFIPFKINLLVDTGASRTQMSWNDAQYAGGFIIRLLPADNSSYTGIGGSVRGYILEQTTLTFKSSAGKYDITIGNLSVSDYETTDGRPCPFTASMLGMDLLSRFDLLFEDTYVMLRM